MDYPPELLKLYLGEGDSGDNTWAELQAWAVEDSRLTVVKRDTGRPRLWHTPKAERLKTLAITANAVWDKLAADAWGEYAWMLESDLLITSDVLRRLVERMPKEAAAIAPMIWTSVEGHFRFYDVWAFRRGGEMFPPYPPAWYSQRYGVRPFEVDSVGSAVLFRMAWLTAGARLSEEEAVVGMCKWIREQGGKIYADPDTHIIHPIVEGAQ